MAITSMKWLFNVVVATRRRFYAFDRKENGTIFGGLKQHGRNESAVANPDPNARCTDIAQLRRGWPR